MVWCPKYRRSVLNDEIACELESIIKTVCVESKSDLLEVQIMPDHVHMLVEVDPQFGIHRLIKRIKGRSANVLRKKYKSLRSRIPTLWTNSYFVSTVGGAPLEIVKRYIEEQKGM